MRLGQGSDFGDFFQRSKMVVSGYTFMRMMRMLIMMIMMLIIFLLMMSMKTN